MLALIVSGGHSQLVLFRDHGDYELLGQTQDDAVGEAFDKVAKILGLPYPGGPSIAAAALIGDPKKYRLPKSKLQNPYDFSFSGLKTAVLRAVQHEVGVDFTFPSHQLAERLNDVQRADFAASFQHIAVETLVDKTEKAFRDYSPASVVIAGGVAANQALRTALSARLHLDIEYAPMQLCTDNAAMIATLGYFYAQVKPAANPFDLEVVPSLSMTTTAWNNRFSVSSRWLSNSQKHLQPEFLLMRAQQKPGAKPFLRILTAKRRTKPQLIAFLDRPNYLLSNRQPFTPYNIQRRQRFIIRPRQHSFVIRESLLECTNTIV